MRLQWKHRGARARRRDCRALTYCGMAPLSRVCALVTLGCLPASRPPHAAASKRGQSRNAREAVLPPTGSQGQARRLGLGVGDPKAAFGRSALSGAPRGPPRNAFGMKGSKRLRDERAARFAKAARPALITSSCARGGYVMMRRSPGTQGAPAQRYDERDQRHPCCTRRAVPERYAKAGPRSSIGKTRCAVTDAPRGDGRAAR